MVIEITAIGLCVCLINALLSKYMSSLLLPVNIAFALFTAVFFLDDISTVFGEISRLSDVSPSVSVIFRCLIKSAGICILARIASQICRQSGSVVIGEIIELTSAGALIVLALPFIEAIIKSAMSMIK